MIRRASTKASLAWLILPLTCIWSFAFEDAFTEPKWLLLRLVGIAALGTLALTGSISYPRLGQSRTLLCLALVAVSAVLTVTTYHPDSVLITLDRMLLVSLVLAFLSFSSEQNPLSQLKMPLAFAVVASALISCGQIAIQLLNGQALTSLGFSGAFGDANLMAQFLALALPVLLFGPSHKWRGFKDFAAATALTFILILQCRSALLGAASVLLFWTFRSRKKESRHAVAVGWIAVAMAILIFTTTIQKTLNLDAASPVAITAIEKSTSTWYRAKLYLKTLSIIANTPWGLGPGGFEFGSLPELASADIRAGTEFLYPTHHNEFLRFLVEDGWLWSILFFGFLLSILFKKPMDDRNNNLEAAFGLALLPELLFQFPLLNAVSFFLVSAWCASILRSRFPIKSFSSAGGPRLALPTRLVLAGVAGLALVFGSRSAIAQYRSAHAINGDGFAQACDADPTQWRICIDAANELVDEAQVDVDRSRATLAREKAMSLPKGASVRAPCLFPDTELCFGSRRSMQDRVLQNQARRRS